jgi:hypothetical protein
MNIVSSKYVAYRFVLLETYLISQWANKFLMWNMGSVWVHACVSLNHGVGHLLFENTGK